jgi:hypothetical protein
LRGGAAEGLSAHWSAFFDHPGAADPQELNLRSASLERQVRDNGVTYNVYADAGGPQRPWSLDLFPLIVTPESLAASRPACCNGCACSTASWPTSMARSSCWHAACCRRRWCRATRVTCAPCTACAQPVGGTHLHIAAFDLARTPDGNWWLVSQRTQAPSGLGYLLENRLAVGASSRRPSRTCMCSAWPAPTAP